MLTAVTCPNCQELLGVHRDEALHEASSRRVAKLRKRQRLQGQQKRLPQVARNRSLQEYLMDEALVDRLKATLPQETWSRELDSTSEKLILAACILPAFAVAIYLIETFDLPGSTVEVALMFGSVVAVYLLVKIHQYLSRGYWEEWQINWRARQHVWICLRCFHQWKRLPKPQTRQKSASLI